MDFLGIDKDIDFLDLSVKRRKEIEDIKIKSQYREKILKYSDRKINDIIQIRETKIYYGIDLLIE